MSKIIKTEPAPHCPKCGARMTLRRPKPEQHWEPFFGCSQFPVCQGTRNIDDEGNPELTEQEFMEANSTPLFDDYDAMKAPPSSDKNISEDSIPF